MPQSPSTNARQSPQDPAAEAAVLGAILLNPDSLDRAQEDGLGPEDFSQPSHRALFDCFIDLHRTGKAIDMVTVPGRLTEQGLFENFGGLRALTDLTAAVPSVANLAHYVKVVREKATLRRLIETLDAIGEDIYSADMTPTATLEMAESRIFELRDSREKTQLARLGPVVEHVFNELRKRSEMPDDVTGVPTGFRDLDKLLSGLQNSDLVILAARPSMGKTAFALNIVAHAALRGGASVAFFSLEMSKEQIGSRMLTSESRVSGSRIRTGRMMNDDWQPMMDAVVRLDQADVHIDDTPAITVGGIRARCRRLAARGKLDLIAVDYLQLMRSDNKEQSREQEISSISRGLKGLAKEMHVPVVALSQLNRGVESRADKRPMMSDLRESGAIEQDADVVMFLYRDEVYNKSPDNQGLAEVLVRKQRNGAIGEVDLHWHGEFARFDNLEKGYR